MKTWNRFWSAAKERRLQSATRTRLREQYYRWSLGQIYFSLTSHCPASRSEAIFRRFLSALLLKQCMHRATTGVSGLPDFVREIAGMSGQKYRTFINNFVGSQSDAQYLEIGSWQGSTAAAALYGNSVKALCIDDNWSQFGGPRSVFLANLERIQAESPSVEFHFVESDFRQVDYASLGHFNIFFFDGPHEESDPI